MVLSTSLALIIQNGAATTLPVGGQVVYRTAFEPTLKLWPEAAIGLLFVFLGVGLFVFTKRKIFSLLFLAIAVLTTVTGTTATVSAYRQLHAASLDPRTPIVEGRVEDFVPAPYEGHKDESFRVDTVTFAYSDYMITGGFNTSRSHGGPIQPGLQVRIRYLPEPPIGNTIVKLEVAE